MPMTAIHPERGRIDATAGDLGCDWTWAAIHRVRPRVPLACPECRHGVRAKVSHLGLRFFAHDPGAPTCGLAGESMEHRLLKLELVTAARNAGWHAALEVPAADGRWRADVMATSPDGTLRMAWEAQLSSITEDEVRQRTDRYARDGVRVCWVVTQPRRWRGRVPSILVKPPIEGQRAVWEVAEGLVRFATEPCHHHVSCFGGHGQWQNVKTPLRDFVVWVLDRQVVPHHFVSPELLSEHQWEQVWTVPQYVTLAADFAKAKRRARRKRAVSGTVHVTSLDGMGPDAIAREVALRITGALPPQRSRRVRSGALRYFAAPSSPEAHGAAGLARVHAAVETWVTEETGGQATVRADEYLAGGTPVYLDNAVYGVIRPDPDQVDWHRWPGRRNWVLFVTSRDELKRIAAAAPNGVRIIELE
ncbi:competence protein CoiA [Streptomyces yunnanensis]|uniref:Competence protein CoiA n=2 Tax=Streptomyces yunnanensis TaxID=156453 RepID=A0A9X8QVX5_9ACTN|nr:competence protein CoiA [Streptomyces yunnanensis]